MDILGLPDDERDALMHAALDAPGSAAVAWQRWVATHPGPFVDPVAQRWLPLIDHNLPADAIDNDMRRRLRDVRHGLWVSNVRTIAAATPAIQALSEAGVPVMLLKGAALALTVYDSPGLRPIGDVDVLVAPEALATARRVLADLSWHPIRRINEHDLALSHGIDLRQPPYGALDVHWYLLHECCWPGVDRGVWERAHPMTHEGLSALVLSPADLLLQVCIHGLRWSPVHSAHWLADASWLIRRSGTDMDWTVVVDEAERRQVGWQLLEALRAVAKWTGTAAPAPALERLEARRPSRRERAECRLKGRPVASLGGLFVIWCGWARASRALHEAGAARPPWLRYLGAAVGVERRQLPTWAFRHARARVGALLGRRAPTGGSRPGRAGS